jgi:hypothetical protein
MLYRDWFQRLIQDAGWSFAQHGESQLSFTFGVPENLQVTATFVTEHPYLEFASSDPAHNSRVKEVARQARARAEAGDLGEIAWWSGELTGRAFQLAPGFRFGALLELLGNRVSINGWRRLGRNVLLRFAEEPSAENPLAPKVDVRVHVAVPTPCVDGYLSHFIAHGALEIVGAVCTFALGRAVQLPFGILPTKPELVEELNSCSHDANLLTLARKGVGLDIFSPTGLPGGLDYFTRLRSAFLTFDAAMQQHHDLVACILYVVVAECLVTPPTKWRDARVTTRFIEFYDELLPAALDQLVAHQNLEALFDIKRGTRSARALRRELLSSIYEFRSGRVHEGFGPTYRGFGSMMSGAEDVRRGYFAEFAESAILGYLNSPRCSFVGHPAYSQPAPED